MRIALQIGLLVIIVVLCYLLVESIMDPIRFQKAKQVRDKVVIERLKDIRAAQRAYKSVNEKYADNFDTLIDFIKNNKFAVIKKIGDVSDSLTEEEGLKRKLIRRDTTYISMIDSLFPAPKSVDSLRFIPFSGGGQFELAAKILEPQPSVKVPVFEAKAPYKLVLIGLDPQQIINLIAEQKRIERYEGLKVGSIEEATNDAGNWEK